MSYYSKITSSASTQRRTRTSTRRTRTRKSTQLSIQ